MNAADVIGWASQASTYCASHKPNRGCDSPDCQDTECCPQPIFASGDEPKNEDGDGPESCDTCDREALDFTPTTPPGSFARYLGDGVYARIERGMIRLDANHHNSPNPIYLELPVADALIAYIREQFENGRLQP